MRMTDFAIMISSSCANNTHHYSTCVCRNSDCVVLVAFFAYSDSKKAKSSQMRERTVKAFSPIPPAKTSVSNPPSAATKDSDPFFGLIAEQRQSFRCSNVLRFPREQIANVGTGLRNSEQSRLLVHHPVELFRAHFLGACQVRNESRIQISRTAAHHQPRSWCEAHACVDARPLCTAARLAPLPRCARITRPFVAAGSPIR